MSVTPNNNNLKPFVVAVFEDAEAKKDNFKMDFFCMAEDNEHAKEQALDAYKEGELISVNTVREDEYPYNIH